MNAVQLIGRLTADPESIPMVSSPPLTKFRLAVDRVGEGTDYVTIATWDRTAEVVAEHLTKGRRVAVVGHLRHHEWTDQPSGSRREAVEVVADQVHFLDARPKDDTIGRAQAEGAKPPEIESR